MNKMTKQLQAHNTQVEIIMPIVIIITFFHCFEGLQHTPTKFCFVLLFLHKFLGLAR